ncbi:MAG TPA: ATP-binding protein [Abditibacteriaceae bacterium]|jgi:signal transduction histidine kinase/CheY-like chemotaxis protein
MIDSSLTTGRSRALLLLLLAAAIAGNYVRFPLVFGLDFLFGSVAVLVVVYCYGIRWGVAAAVVSSLYTLHLWHHPYALLIFTVEALFIGLAMRRTPNMLLLDGMFWLLIGMPLVWIFYFQVLHTESTQTWLIMLKDAVNGIFNALIASLIVTHTPLRTWPGHTYRQPLVPINQAVFNICVGCVLFPTLLLLFTDSQETLHSVEWDIQNDLISQSEQTDGIFQVWRRRRFDIVRSIASLASGASGGSSGGATGLSPDLARNTTLLARAFPDFAAILVRTTDNKVSTFYVADGALSTRLRPVLEQQAAQSLRSTVRDDMTAHWDAEQPLAIMSVPTRSRAVMPGKAPIRGVVVAALDLSYVNQLMSAGLPSETMSASVIDAARRFVTSIGPQAIGGPQATEVTLLPNRAPGTIRRFDNGIYHWLPPTSRPAVERWKNSIFVRETPIRGTPWTLVLQAPLAQRHNALNTAFYGNLLLVLILLVATLLLASILSRALTLPLSRLAQETTGLPARVSRGEAALTFLQPRNPMLEIETLITNFQVMAGTLQQSFAELHSARQQLEIEQERLTEANRLKDEFLAILSHEMRTPLVPIIGYADLIARGVLKEEDRVEGARSIERNARAQLRLIEDLLDVSRIITGKLSLQVGKVDLAQTIRDAMETVNLSARAKGIELKYDELDHIPPILGDEARLRQVIWNLLSNAVKFTPQDGRVVVTLRRIAGETEIAVADSGQGVTEDFLPHVFDRFRQGSDHLTRSAGGLGLGLAIVKHLVELHGGTITVHSAGEDQGTTFRLRLPARGHDDPSQSEAASADTTPTRRARPEVVASTQSAAKTVAKGFPQSAPTAGPPQTLYMQHRLPGAKVLVIDDEADGREMLMATLRLEGATVLGAGSAQEALDLTETEIPDAIVCDIGMPVMDGYDFLVNLRQRPQFERVPIVAFTAFASKHDRDHALSSGFDAYLSKPAISDEVIDVLERVVERH